MTSEHFTRVRASFCTLLALGGCYGAMGPPVGSLDAGAPDAPEVPDTSFVPEPERLRIDASAATLEVRDGATAPVALGAMLTDASGTWQPVSAGWTVAPAELASIDADGLLTASGWTGGVVTVTATVQSLRTGVWLTVDRRFDVNLAYSFLSGLDDSSLFARFDAAGVDPDITVPEIAYPLGGAVMPRNVYPPEVQWRAFPASPSRVLISRPHVSIAALVSSRRWAIDMEAWRALARANPNDPVTVEVTSFHVMSGRRGRPSTIEITLTAATLGGTIYLWDVEASTILQVEDGSGAATEVFEPRPADCVGCHAISRDGRRMAASLTGDVPSGGSGRFIGGVFDLSTEAGLRGVAEFPPTSARLWYTGTFSPDESLLAVDSSTGLSIIDVATGGSVPLSRELPSLAQPCWSPDGRWLAYTDTSIAPGDVARYHPEANDLSIVSVTSGTSGIIEVGEPRSLDAAWTTAPAGTESDDFPSFSPDSRFVAFARDSRRLGLVQTEGGEEPVWLTRGVPADGAHPVFAPTESGDHYWIAYQSSMPYGTSDESGTPRVSQIWVTAVRRDFAAGEDPSEVPFRVEGQRNHSLSAYWSRRACRPSGEVCDLDGECCSGGCVVDPSGGHVCGAATTCRQFGETCASESDCCETRGLSCVDRACVDRLY